MPIKVPRGQSDDTIDQIIGVLGNYQADYPDAQIDLYRQNAVSVRVRIIDPSFVGQDRIQRHKLVWSYLDPLPEEVQSDISTLILLAPNETKKSIANVEFDDPLPSRF